MIGIILNLLLFHTPLAIITVPVYMLYLHIQDCKARKKRKHWQPESPYEKLPENNKNTHYGVDL